MGLGDWGGWIQAVRACVFPCFPESYPRQGSFLLSKKAHKTAAWQQDGGGEGILKQLGGLCSDVKASADKKPEALRTLQVQRAGRPLLAPDRLN